MEMIPHSECLSCNFLVRACVALRSAQNTTKTQIQMTDMFWQDDLVRGREQGRICRFLVFATGVLFSSLPAAKKSLFCLAHPSMGCCVATDV